MSSPLQGVMFKMAGNNSIQILRGNSSAISSSNQTLLDGQLLYDKTNNYLYIGNGNQAVNSATLINPQTNLYMHRITFSSVNLNGSQCFSITDSGGTTTNYISITNQTMQFQLQFIDHNSTSISNGVFGSRVPSGNYPITDITNYNPAMLRKTSNTQCRINLTTVEVSASSGNYGELYLHQLNTGAMTISTMNISDTVTRLPL